MSNSPLVLTMEECFAYTERRKHHWWLVGIEIATKSPTYQCSACNNQRIKLVSAKATLPDACPKCKSLQGPSLDDDRIPIHLRREVIHD